MRYWITTLPRHAALALSASLVGLLLLSAPALSCPNCDKAEHAACNGGGAPCAEAKKEGAACPHAKECADCPRAKDGAECPYAKDGAACPHAGKDGACPCKDKAEGAACPCAGAKEGDAPCACKAAAAAGAAAGPAGEKAAAPAAGKPTLGGVAEQKAYVDPVTGKLTTPPPADPEAVAPEAADVVPSRAAALEPVPGGGVKAELGQAYRANVEATRGADGKVHVGCEEDAAKAPAEQPPAAKPEH